MKKIITLLLCLGMSGACATTNEQTDKKQQAKRTYQADNIPRSVDKIIKSMEGCSKEFVFDVLGLPNDERTIDNQKYFYWETNSNYTSFWTGNNNQQNCIIHGKVNSKGIIEEISYRDFRKGCNYIYVDIVRYYAKHTQDEHNCPNRKDFYGKFTVTEEY